MRSFPASFVFLAFTLFLFTSCSNSKTDAPLVASKTSYGGFESQIDWGRHLVTVSGCHDCHSPKKMTPQGPVIDSANMLAGYMGTPQPDIDKKVVNSKGLIVTSDLTSWVGPWGTSFTANLTSDATGIGNWTESQFMLAIREGKYKGLPDSRSLLPPMPWDMYRNFTDEELKALFAYLKTTKPVKNIVPQPLPPASN